MLDHVPSSVSGIASSGCFGDGQVEEDWKQGDPPCICGFAMDRCAADAALRFQPVGAFLVRMCSEPGSFAISCRTSNDPHHMNGGLPGEWDAFVRPWPWPWPAASIARLHQQQQAGHKST